MVYERVGEFRRPGVCCFRGRHTLEGIAPKKSRTRVFSILTLFFHSSLNKIKSTNSTKTTFYDLTRIEAIDESQISL